MRSYIDMINRFWQTDRRYSFSASETRLYFYLLNVANDLTDPWPDEFELADSKLTDNCGLSKNTLRACRLKLESAGFFAWQMGGKGKGNRARYQLRYHALTPRPMADCLLRYQELTPNLTPLDSLVSGKASVKVSENHANTYIETEDLLESSTSDDRCQKMTSKIVPANPLADSPPAAPRCAPPPPSAVRPARLDPYNPKNADLVNVPFSSWWPLYDTNVQERRCRMLWIELTDEERLIAAEHIPRYVEATKHDDKRWRKNPEKYLAEKIFNDEIRSWHENNTKSNPATAGAGTTGQRDVIRTTYGPPPRRR